MLALVLGGGGFLGRHVVGALRARGHDVVAASRRPPHRARIGRNAPDCRWRSARFECLQDSGAWSAVIAGCDVVVNCVGILRPTPGVSYDVVHHHAPSALAHACRSARVRLVHISALGLSGCAGSGFIRSKWHGEQGILASGAACTLVRPSLLDGDGGYGARWIRALAALPIHVIPARADGRIAVLDVRDAAEAIAVLSEAPVGNGCEVAELGGLAAMTMSAYLQAHRAAHGLPPARSLRLPLPFACLASHLCDALHVSPFSFGHLELMRGDNVPAINALPALLGRAPRTIAVTGLPLPAHTPVEPARKRARWGAAAG